jgi:heat shock protein HslJ
MKMPALPLRNVLVLLFVLMGCESTTSRTELETAQRASPVGSWSLTAFDLAGGRTVLVPAPERYLLDLSAKPDAHVRADCNFCNGGYRVDGSTLELGLLACTLAACQPGSLDGQYLRALGSASSWFVEKGRLSIVYPEGVLRFGPK